MYIKESSCYSMEHQPKLLTGKKFFVYMLLFFGIIFSVNAVFITLALRSNSGVVVQNYYERGIHYNQTLEQAQFQKELGWMGELVIDGSFMIYSLHASDGKAVSDKTIFVKMVRPVQDGFDFMVPLSETKDGVYRGKFHAPLKGAWDAHISIEWADGQYFDFVPVVLD